MKKMTNKKPLIKTPGELLLPLALAVVMFISCSRNKNPMKVIKSKYKIECRKIEKQYKTDIKAAYASYKQAYKRAADFPYHLSTIQARNEAFLQLQADKNDASSRYQSALSATDSSHAAQIKIIESGKQKEH